MNATILIISALVLMVVLGSSYGVYLLANPTRTAGDRLTEFRDREEDDGGFEIAAEPSGMDAIAGRLGSLMGAQSAEEISKQRAFLLQAGYKHKNAFEILNGVKVTLAISLPMLMIPLLSAGGVGLAAAAFVILGSAAAGMYLPQVYVTNLVNKRSSILLGSFPDCLDLMVSSVEAGLGVDAAFRRVAQEMEASAPELSKEFQLVNHEISAGVPRIDAMTHLYERTGLDEVRSLVNMLSQSERFGTSIAKSLRVHAKTSREKRMARAEEEAAKVAPKLTVVMIVFLLPVLMSVLMGPALINVKNSFGGG